MKTANKILLAGTTALGLGLVASPALAQTIGGAAIQCGPNGGTNANVDCAANGAADFGSGNVTTTGTVSAGAVTATTVTGDLTGNVTGNLTGNVTGNVTGNLTGDVTSTGLSSFNNVNVTGFIQTGDATAVDISDVEGLDFSGGGSITGVNNVTATGTIQGAALVATGNASVGGNLDMTGGDLNNVGTLNAATLNVGALSATSFETDNVTSASGSLLLDTTTGTSYVQVNEDSVVIHGGTTSTTVVVDDSGFTVQDDDGVNPPVTTFAVSSSGNAALLGTLTAGGVVSSGNVVVGDGIAAGTGQNAIATGVTINSTTQRITGVANGVLSATSNDVVTGQQLFATNNRITNLEAVVADNFARLTDRANKAYQGVAMGFAMNAAPLNLDNGEGGLSGGVGYFQGEWAGAVKAQYVTDAGVGVGVNVGFSEDAVGGGVGASIKF